MEIKDVSEEQVLSDIAKSLVQARPPRPDEADGWRTFSQLLDETGLTPAVLREAINKGIRDGRYEVVKCSPACYRLAENYKPTVGGIVTGSIKMGHG